MTKNNQKTKIKIQMFKAKTKTLKNESRDVSKLRLKSRELKLIDTWTIDMNMHVDYDIATAGLYCFYTRDLHV